MREFICVLTLLTWNVCGAATFDIHLRGSLKTQVGANVSKRFVQISKVCIDNNLVTQADSLNSNVGHDKRYTVKVSEPIFTPTEMCYVINITIPDEYLSNSRAAEEIYLTIDYVSLRFDTSMVMSMCRPTSSWVARTGIINAHILMQNSPQTTIVQLDELVADDEIVANDELLYSGIEQFPAASVEERSRSMPLVAAEMNRDIPDETRRLVDDGTSGEDALLPFLPNNMRIAYYKCLMSFYRMDIS